MPLYGQSRDLQQSVFDEDIATIGLTQAIVTVYDRAFASAPLKSLSSVEIVCVHLSGFPRRGAYMYFPATGDTTFIGASRRTRQSINPWGHYGEAFTRLARLNLPVVGANKTRG